VRDEFVRTLTQIARKDRNVTLITGDLGFGVLDQFAEEFPAQYVNAGVAEQNMTGLAVGLALEGKIVFTYSIANFPTLRCLEQIRNDACYHQANVKIVAIGGGFAYGPLGISHHATEDLAIMRALPQMTVVAPADPAEVRAATEAIYQTPGTCYLRLGRGGEAVVHSGKPDFRIGRAIRVLDGTEIVYLTTGAILKNTLDACRALQARGKRPALYSVHTLKPLDLELVETLARRFRVIITVEEHSVVGGLGGAVAESLSQMEQPRAQLKLVGLRNGFSSIVGDQAYLREAYGLSVQDIESAAWESYRSVREAASSGLKVV
jgi:transketolase